MLSRLALSSIFVIICVIISVNSAKVKSKMGPSGMSFEDNTNCSTFSKFGRFNPYSVLHEKWFVFFYWAHPRQLTTYVFTFPTANHTKHLKKILEGNTILPVMWSARQILMEDQNKDVSLLVERDDRGAYWWYPLYRVKKGGPKISPRDVRLKQTGDNRILGYMDCADETLLVMSRINDVPPKNRLQEEASRLGYRGRRGKSYLYQGHEWVPIPEDDEKNFWEYRKELKDSSPKDIKNSEQSSAEELPANEFNKNTEEETKTKTDSQVKFNEGELKERCERIEPVLWSDPKPAPVSDPDKIPITRDDLNNPSINLMEDNQFMESTENDLAKEREPVKENEKQDDHQNDPKESKANTKKADAKPKQKKHKPKKPSIDNCDACIEMRATDNAYIPESVLNHAKSKDVVSPIPNEKSKA